MRTTIFTNFNNIDNENYISGDEENYIVSNQELLVELTCFHC